MTEKKPIIHALWIGNKLGVISRSCLRSFVIRGHTVHLHTYGKIEDLPEGVTVCDARSIVKEEDIFKHTKSGSYALFSDSFRYELLKKVDGIYVDCDVYCLKPLSMPDSGYLIGYEEDGRVNGAVLALPKDSELLSNLILASQDSYFIPPWYSDKKKFRMGIRKKLGLAKTLSNMPWGIIGPDAITFYVKHLDLDKLIEPIDVFYPVHHKCITQLTDPSLAIKDITSNRTLCIHLYNEKLKNCDILNLDKNSVLYKIINNDT